MRARHAMRALSGSPLPRVRALSWVGGPVRSLRLARLEAEEEKMNERPSSAIDLSVDETNMKEVLDK